MTGIGYRFRTVPSRSGRNVAALEKISIPNGDEGFFVAKAPDEIDVHVGSRVRLRRMMLGMSQEQLAASLGLTFQQVQKYERGMNRIGAGRLYQIARSLSVPVAFFYEGLADPTEGLDSGAASEEMDRVMGFLLSPEGLSLATGFQRIADTVTRRRLVDLVKTLGGLNGEA